jgi:hypothetical protein
MPRTAMSTVVRTAFPRLLVGALTLNFRGKILA